MRLLDYIKGLKVPLYFTSIGTVLLGWALTGFQAKAIVILILLVVVSMQAALNTSMDYFDNLNGRKLRNDDTLFPLGSFFVEKLQVNPRHLLIAFIVLTIIAVSLGLIVVFITRNLWLLVLGLTAVFLSLLYVLPPVRLGSRGVGEIATFFSFGPFPLLGTIIALGKEVTFQTVLISITMGLLASSIRFLHHSPEDKIGGFRQTNFLAIYVSFTFIGLAAALFVRGLLIPSLVSIFVALVQVYYLPSDNLRASRRTNGAVTIQLLFTLLALLFIYI